MKYQLEYKYQLLEKLTPSTHFQNEFPGSGIRVEIKSKEDRLKILKDRIEKELINQDDYDREKQKILNEKD